MTDKQSKLTDVTHAPPLMIRVIVANLVLWLFVIPALVLIQQQRIDLLYMPFLGLVLIPIVLMVMFLQRVLLWVYFTFFWYLQGCLSLLSIFAGFVAILLVIQPGARDKPPLTAIRDFQLESDVFNNVLILVFLGLAIVGLYSLVRRIIPGKVKTPQGVKS